MSNRAQRGVAADSHYVAIFGSVALIALTALFGLWLLIAVVSVFRPDSKRPNGTFESYAGLVRKDEGRDVWGRLSLADGVLTFAPHEELAAAFTLQLNSVSKAVFPPLSDQFWVFVARQCISFRTFKRPTFKYAGLTGSAWTASRAEWLRQFQAAGVAVSRVAEQEPPRTGGPSGP